MDKKTPNKRKSLANAKETPNKIRKTTTPVSQKLNNKSPKSTNTKQKIPQTQKNNKIITPKGRKLTKQIEEDETDDESDELNGTNGNDAVNSDNEIEASSDEDAENGEADSDEQADSDEEAENGEADSDGEEAASDDEAEIDETNSDENVLERNAKDSSGDIKKTHFSIYVKGLNPRSKLKDVFKDCNIFKYRIDWNPATNMKNKQAFVTFTDKESLTKALKLDGTRHENQVLSVKPYIEPKNRQHVLFQIYVKNLSENTKVEDVFKDCKIRHTKVINSGVVSRIAVYFEDEESVQKALLQQGTEHDGRVISVFKPYCSVRVINLNVDSKVEDVFKDCNIQGVELLEDKKVKKYNERAIVHFKDKESVQKALAKHNTEIDGNTIGVVLYGANPIYSENGRFNQPRKYGNSGQFKPTPRESYNPGSKIAFLKKQLLLEELKLETQKLEREIYKQSKPFNHRKQFQK